MTTHFFFIFPGLFEMNMKESLISFSFLACFIFFLPKDMSSKAGDDCNGRYCIYRYTTTTLLTCTLFFSLISCSPSPHSLTLLFASSSLVILLTIFYP